MICEYLCVFVCKNVTADLKYIPFLPGHRHTVPKTDLCIPRNETAWPRSQFHECGNWEIEHYSGILFWKQ
jgi:hypothetical protein